MRTSLLILPLVFTSFTASAQYQGGGGPGTSTRTVTALGLGIPSMYSGGVSDGTAILTALAQSLASVSQYSGGSNDGHGTITQLSLSLSMPSSYNGGSGDGTAGVTSFSLSLLSPGMYAGGISDGFNGQTVSALTLAIPGSYSGGPNDGASELLGAALNLSTSGMFAGGGNDGTGNISVNALGMHPSSSMYSGSGNDGFASVSAMAITIALPITWEDFTLSRRNADAILHWQVGNARDDKGFEIQRSYDGAYFSKIGYVAASAGLSSMSAYTYADADPAKYCPEGDCRQVYYRLRQLSLSGDFSFSPIRRLALDPASMEASVYPNPTADKVVIRIKAAPANGLVYSLGLYNSIGVAVYSSAMLSQPMIEIDVHDYPSGNYYLRLSLNGITYPYQITITH